MSATWRQFCLGLNVLKSLWVKKDFLKQLPVNQKPDFQILLSYMNGDFLITRLLGT